MENQQVQTAPAPVAKSKGLAVASLVLGILAFLTGLIYLGAILGILAVIFGIIALKKRQPKGLAITGIVTGALGIMGTIVAITLVMLALPVLQQQQRDTSRKNQVALTVAQITQYQSENQGKLPDPEQLSTSFETATLKVAAHGEPTTDTMVYKTGASCDGTVEELAYSVTVKLENGQLYCQGS